MAFNYDHDDEEECPYYPGLSRLSRLSIETSDGGEADAEMSDDDAPAKITNAADKDHFIGEGGVASLPGTPERAGPWAKEYGSETEGKGARDRGKRGSRRRTGWAGEARERLLDRAWELRRCNSERQCRVLVKSRGPDSGPICMDMDEVKACRELGLELPCDWTVEIPCGFSGVDTSSDGNSPVGNWRISSPGDDPKVVKARLKMWAQAVALASASSLSG